MEMLRRAAAFLAVAIGIACAGPLSAAPYAALVVDARTGQVLHESSPDRKLHPASLTKMMTLYLTFEAVTSGRLSLDQRVAISRRAAAQPASKIYMRVGQRVTIRDLIRATAVKSANDAAVALAEAIGGSEAQFARIMTERARRMGMTNTAFKNASGLTARGQYSTARDMARMGRALFFDFPQYYNLFSRISTRTMGKTVYATNRRLLRSYRGADGIKTGYTNAAGFNLVSSAKRGDKRVIAVVFGGKSSASRNHRIAELLDLGFRNAPAHAVVQRPRTRLIAYNSPTPTPRPGAGETIESIPEVAAALLSEAGEALVPSAKASERPGAGAIYTKWSPRVSPAPLLRPSLSAGVASNRPQTSGKAARARSKARSDRWAVQIGVYPKQEAAVAELAAAALSNVDGLERAGRQVAELTLSGRPAYRARLTGFDQVGALSACEALKTRGRDCLPIASRSAH